MSTRGRIEVAIGALLGALAVSGGVDAAALIFWAVLCAIAGWVVVAAVDVIVRVIDRIADRWAEGRDDG